MPVYLVHGACWSLLRCVYGQRTVPLARLVEIAGSLCCHLSRSVINWGHLYGGMAEISGIGLLHYSVTGRSETWRSIEQDPFPDGNDTWRRALQQGPMQSKKAGNRRESKPYPSKSVESRSEVVCCLDQLPVDIWFEIFSYLKVHDCLQLRFISSQLSRVIQSSHFWTSKIKSEECDFAFEASELEPGSFVDPRWIHRFICIQRATSLRNRARIWEMAQCLKSILDLPEPDTTTIDNGTNDPESLVWVDVTWPIKATNLSLSCSQRSIENCQILYTQRVILASHLRRITVSWIEMGGTEYITGLELSFDGGTSTQLGYKSRDNSSVDVAAFGGFVVAAGTSGIHGLQIIDEGSRVSKWLGSNKRCPQTRRLKLDGEIVGISASFDVRILANLASNLPPLLMAD